MRIAPGDMLVDAARIVATPLSKLTRGGIVVGEQVATTAINGLRPRIMHAAGMVLDAERPITLVSGYGADPAGLRPLKLSLEAAGARNVHVFQPIDHALGDINRNGAKLGAELLSRPEGDVIAWSEGGLISLSAMLHHGANGVVRRLVTVGTPHGGSAKVPGAGAAQALDGVLQSLHVPTRFGDVSDAATSQLVGTAAVQMQPGSEFLRSIHGDYSGGIGTPGPTKYLAIASEHDGMVPFASAHLPAADNVQNVEIHAPWQKANHVRIMTANDESFQAMLRFLGDGAPAS